MRQDYDMAKRNGRFRRRRAGVSSVGTTGDYHYRNEADFLYTIEYARDLDRNDSVAGMIIDRLQDNILQETGITIDPDTGDDDLNGAIKDSWGEWANDEDACDLAGELTFYDMERTVMRSWFVDGDIVALPNESGAIELMEAHRLRTPTNTKRNVVHGVLLSEDRRRLEYWFTKDEIDPSRAFARVSEATAIPVRDSEGHRQVFHVYDPARVSQTRGVSAFRRCSDALGMHDDIEFANLVRQQIAACFLLIRKKTQQYQGGKPGTYGPQHVEQTDSGSRVIEGISPGLEISTRVGEDIEGFSPDVPNPQFFEHVQLILKIVSANLNLPLHAVLLDASQTNFSGWRGAIDQARGGFRRIQRTLTNKFHRRVYLWKLRSFIARNNAIRRMAERIEPARVFKHKWHRPTWEYIEPLKDATADIAKMRGMICSMRTIHSRRGEDFDDVIPEIIDDNAWVIRKAREAARELNRDAEESEKVNWRELLALPLHQGLSVKLDGESSERAESMESGQRESINNE